MAICASRQVGLFVPGHGGQASTDQNIVQETLLINSASVSVWEESPSSNHSGTAMAMGRAKKVTDPLNDLVRALLCGHSETSTATNYGGDHYPNSACLADLVHAFVEEEYQEKNAQIGNRSNDTVEICSHNILESADGESNSNSAEDESNASFGIAELKQILQGLVSSIHTNALEALLHKEAATAVDMFRAKQNQAQDCKGCGIAKESGDKVKQKSLLKQCVMDHLRGHGYNAGVCKSRRGQAHGFRAGEYEYIDVIIDGKERILVDIDFKVEFVIARPTRHYNALFQILPDIFVGKANRLKQIIRVMSDSAKKSLKKRGMHLPPWRKYECMQTKWLGCYKRSMRVVASSDAVEGREIGKSAGSNGLWWERRGEGEWMPPPVMVRGERGAKVSVLASAFNEAAPSSLTT